MTDGQTAQAEVNHPQWAKAIEIIHPKARELSGKPRYWPVAYALVVASLCVSPTDYFLRNWAACFEAGLGKLKVVPLLGPVLCLTRSIALGKNFPYSRYEWDDASHLDLHVPLPRIVVDIDIENGITTQKLFPP
jgi:Cell morphogenesis N-terminal